MVNEKLLEYCIAKKGAYLDFPFGGNEYAVIKISNENTKKFRIFAEIFSLNNNEMLTFSTDSEMAIALREIYPNKVVKGYHCPPVQAKYKSTAYISEFDWDTLYQFVDTSYEFAKQKLRIK